MIAFKKPEPARFLNEFLTTMAQEGSLNYCGVCLRTENERRLVDHKALITFTHCVALTRQWKNKFICYMCHRQALKAVTFLRGVSFAGNMDALFSDLLDQKKNLNKDVFQKSIFHALLIKHGMGGLKYSPEDWETELRCIRRATTLKCRPTKVTGVGTGRPQQDRLSSGNLYVVHKDSDDIPSNPESELATNQNQSTSASEDIDPTSSNRDSVVPTTSGSPERSLTPNQEEDPTTNSENPDCNTSLNPGLPTQINRSFACRKGAQWTRKRRPISAAELRATSARRETLYESYFGRSTDEEISRTVQRLCTGQNRSNRGARRKSTLDEAGQSRSSIQSGSRAVLTTVDEVGPSRVEPAGPSREEQAGPSRVEQAGPSRVEQAGPSRVEQAGPSRVEQAGPSRVEQAGPSRVEQAGPSRVEQAGPSRVEQAGHSRVEQAGPSRVEQAGPSRVEQAGPSRVEQARPSRVEQARPSRARQALPSRARQVGPSRVKQARPSRVGQAGPSRVKQVGHSRVEQARPSRVEQARPSRVEQAGPRQASEADLSRASEAGPSRVPEAGPSWAPEAGPSWAPEAGPSWAPEAGPSWASEAGPSWASEAGPSWASEAGPSRPYKPGPNWFYEAGPSWAYDVVSSCASQAAPSSMHKARHIGTDEAGTSRMDQAGAGPISSKECRKDVGGTRIKRSKSSRPVSKNHTTTDGAVDNIVIPPQPQSEKIVILDDGEEDNEIALHIEKTVAAVSPPQPQSEKIVILDDGEEDNEIELHIANTVAAVSPPQPQSEKIVILDDDEEDNEIELHRENTVAAVSPPQPQSEKIVILDDDEEDNEIELHIEKTVAADMAPDPLLTGTPKLTKQLNEPVNCALKHDNTHTVYYVPENKLRIYKYSPIIITGDHLLTQSNKNSNSPLTQSNSPAPSQSESGQSGPNRKRSLDDASMISTPNKRAVLLGWREDCEDKNSAGVISFKSAASPSSNPQMPPPATRYVAKTPPSVRMQEPPRTHTDWGDVRTSAQVRSTQRRQEPVNRALQHDNTHTVYFGPENQLGGNKYSPIIITEDRLFTQNYKNSNSPLTQSNSPAPSQSESGQSGPNRKRSLDDASMMATPNKRAVLPGWREDWEDKNSAGVISFKSAASPSSNPQMPPPTPPSVRMQEPPRTHTDWGDVHTSAQHSSTRNPSPQMTPATAQKWYGRTTPSNVWVQGPPRTHRGGSEVFISAQAAVRINPDPDGPRTGRPAHGPLRKPRYVGRNQGQPAVQDVIRKYTMSSEESD